MTKDTKKADDKADVKPKGDDAASKGADTTDAKGTDTKSEAEMSREVQKDTVNPADRPANEQTQDEGASAKGPGQSSGEPMRDIAKEDLRGDPEEFLDARENEDVVLTEHDPRTDPEEPLAQKLEKDQLHQEDDGRIRTGEGKVAWAPPGSYDAAKNGVQQDASGSFTSANLPGGARVS